MCLSIAQKLDIVAHLVLTVKPSVKIVHLIAQD